MVLAVAGGARLHLQNFVLFLVILIAIAAAVLAVFVVTADGESAMPGGDGTGG